MIERLLNSNSELARRLVIKSIQPTNNGPVARFTIAPGPIEGIYKLLFQTPRDRVAEIQFDTIVFPLGHGSIVRFNGRVPFPPAVTTVPDQPPEHSTLTMQTDQEGMIKSFSIRGWLGYSNDSRSSNATLIPMSTLSREHAVFVGDESDPLTFALLKGFGLVYLHGKGTVITADGSRHQLPEENAAH